MKLAIVLPAPSNKAIGGYKIIYEYAKYLSSTYGHDVTIYYDIQVNDKMHFLVKTKLYFIGNFTKFFDWFDFLDAKVKHHVYFNLQIKRLKDYDCILATAAPVAKKIQLSTLSIPVLYFIQHYEDWSMSEQELIKTYKAANFYNIVISDWLQDILIGNKAKITKLLPNPIDHDKFYMTINPEDRYPSSISMMYHPVKWKGSDEGIQALTLVKEKLPDFTATLFSVYPKPNSLPEWITYIYEPTQKRLQEIYNESALFLSPSIKEGYGLPPAEAMACGAMVITTDSGGVTTFCKDQKTAIVVQSPPNPQEIACVIMDFINDNDLRIRLANDGNAFIHDFKWENNVSTLEQLIKEICYES